MKKYLFYAVVLSVVVFSCDNGTDGDGGEIILPSDIMMIVVNEGNFEKANSDLSTITYGGDVDNKVFEQKNKRPLGDAGQSITYIGGKYYITLSNSAKVEVVDAADFSQIATILEDDDKIDLTPQYIVSLGNSEAYMSDLTSNSMPIIDVTKNKIIGYINAGMPTGQMVYTNNRVFVAAYNAMTWTYDNILVIENQRVIETIDLAGMGQSKIIKDKLGSLWVISETVLASINPITMEIEKRINIPAEAEVTWPARLDVNLKRDSVFFNRKVDGKATIYGHWIEDDVLKEPLFKANDVVNAYNFSVSPVGTFFITDANDYVQSGKIYHYSRKGQVLGSYTLGIIPQDILFTAYNK